MRVHPLAPSSWRFRDWSGSAWLPARVPGCVHTDLLRAKVIPDPLRGTNEAALQWIDERDWEYSAEYRVDSALLAEDVVELVADGLDTIATVRLNASVVARTDNMFIGHRWNVRRLLRRGRNAV